MMRILRDPGFRIAVIEGLFGAILVAAAGVGGTYAAVHLWGFAPDSTGQMVIGVMNAWGTAIIYLYSDFASVPATALYRWWSRL